jgi:hypothetical protein
MSEWQPIETAPKNSVRILVYSPKYKEQFVVRWMVNIDDNVGHWVIGRIETQTLIVRDAVYWMPLPKPPEVL